MANTKVTELTGLTAPSASDLLYVVDDPAGTPTSKKITITDLLAALPSDINFAANGSAADPVITGSTSNTGIYFTTGSIGFSDTGVDILQAYISGGVAALNSTGKLRISASGALAITVGTDTSCAIGASEDTKLYRDAANTLALRNSTNAQKFSVYNTYTDASNYERGVLEWDTNTFVIETENAGTGILRVMRINSSGLEIHHNGTRKVLQGATNWKFETNLYFTDNTYDIGASGANRPKDIYLGGDITQGGYHDMTEMTAPSGTANNARIYAEDNGSGKTRLMVVFGSGAAQQIAIEP